MVALPFFTSYIAVSKHRHRLLSSLKSSFSSSPPPLPSPLPQIAKLSTPCTHNLRHSTGVALSEEQQQQQQLRSHDLVALQYAELNLPHRMAEDLGHVRIRQHVNPLRSSLSVPVEVPEWNSVFKDPTLPLMVDIGCGNRNSLDILFLTCTCLISFVVCEENANRRNTSERFHFWLVKDRSSSLARVISKT